MRCARALRAPGAAALGRRARGLSTPAGPCVLDGGMGHQLKAMGIKIEGPVGSMRRFLGVALANVQEPEKVRDAHLAFIDAGARIITTNTYSCVPKCLTHTADEELQSLTSGGIGKLIAAAGKCARDACKLRPEKNVKVAGSLPPLAESYRPDKVGTFEDNLRDYRAIVASIAPYSDLLLCETMSTADEARAACTAAVESGLPVWVAWTLDEVRPVLRSGESVEDAVAAVVSVPGADKALEACLFNCTSPEAIVACLPRLKAAVPEGVKVGGYANGFVTASAGSGEYRDLGKAEYYEDFVTKWIESGATVVGGCCGIFPEHIAAITRGLAAAE